MLRFLLIVFVLCFCLIQTSFAQVDERQRQIVAQNKRGSSTTGNYSAEELRQLVLFKDIVVIQRRFLPKVSRFEFNPNLRWIINDPFHYHFMGFGRLGYNFSEILAVEIFGGMVFGPDRKITNDLKRINIQVSSVVSPRWVTGIGIKWSPLYGKFGGIGGSILPFDMYFSLGGGISQLETTIRDTQSSTFTPCEAKAITVNLETGQLIPLSKSIALRWGVGWFLHPKAFEWTCGDNNPLGSDQRPGFVQDIYLSLGLSLFFPGAKYR